MPVPVRADVGVHALVRARARKKAVWKICRYACPGDRVLALVPHALLQGKYTSLVDRGHKVLKASAVHHRACTPACT